MPVPRLSNLISRPNDDRPVEEVRVPWVGPVNSKWETKPEMRTMSGAVAAMSGGTAELTW